MTQAIVRGIFALSGSVVSAGVVLGYTQLQKKVVEPTLMSKAVAAIGGEIKHLKSTANWKVVAAASACSLAVYAGFKSGLVYKIADKLIPGMRALKTKMGMEPPIEICASGKKTTVFESLRAGSEQVALPLPKYQVLVGFMKGGVFNANGCGVRMGEWLVVPGHVFAPCSVVAIKGRQGWIELDKDVSAEEIDTDLYAIKLTAKQWSVVGATVAKVLLTLEMAGDWASIVGPSGIGTTGCLRHDSKLFGRLIYSGSTVAGYSGAGYNAGGSLAGVHTNGGAVNSGYSAAYINCLLNRLDRIVPEDSSQWLQHMYKEKRPLKLDRRLEGGEVNIFVDGTYTTVHKSSLVQAFGAEWEEVLRSPKASYGDVHYESLSGEASNSMSGASSLLAQSPGTLSSSHQRLIEECKSLSKTQSKKAIKMLTELHKNTSSQASSTSK